MLGLYPHTEALRQVAVSRFPPSLTLIFLRSFYGFLLSLPWPTHPPSFTPTAGRLLTLLRLGVAPNFWRHLAAPDLVNGAESLEFSGRFPESFSVHSGSSAGGIPIEFGILTHEFSELSRHSQIPSFFLRLFGILTEIDFARLSSPTFIHIMRTLEDSRAEFRPRPARAGPRGSFGSLLDPD